jgi:hypothetical protein
MKHYSCDICKKPSPSGIYILRLAYDGEMRIAAAPQSLLRDPEYMRAGTTRLEVCIPCLTEVRKKLREMRDAALAENSLELEQAREEKPDAEA